MTDLIQFSRYGITLREFTRDDIEMVRQWRNDPKISSLMLDQTYITEEMQQRWFARISQSDTDYYFIAEFKDQPIGVASLTAIDRREGSCEPGMYIYADEYRNNIVPFAVAFALNDLAFETFQLTTLHGKIFTENQASIRFHEACGYQSHGVASAGLQFYRLTTEHYIPARDKLARFIRY